MHRDPSPMPRRDWLRWSVASFVAGPTGLMVAANTWANQPPADESASDERPSDVPAGAVKFEHDEFVAVYHWWSMLSKRVYRVYARPVITRWPTGNWGAQVSLTPIPFCCGAKMSHKVWRKSASEEIKSMADLTTDKQYQIGFVYK